MAVEQFSVGLGTSNPYDNISAVVRGKTEPKNGQSFTADIGSGILVGFEIEDATEIPRSGSESYYSISGRELRSEFLYRAVDFTMQMNFRNGAFGLPSVTSILGQLGLSIVYDAPDFTPTVAGMGWPTVTTTTKSVNGTSYSCKVRILEKNVQALLDRLFSWTAEFGKRKICWHVRGGTIFIWELQRATGSALTISNAICPTDKLRIQRSRVRKFTEVTNTSGDGVSTPTSSIGIEWDYGDIPYSGSFRWNGALMSYSNGLLTDVVVDEDEGATQTRYGYSTFLGCPIMVFKEVKTPKKRTETTFSYEREREGSTTGNGRAVPVLSFEETISWKKNNDGIYVREAESNSVLYCPLGNGFYGSTATRYVNGKAVSHQSVVSKGSPGGAASQYTNRQVVGWHQTGGGTASFPGYVLAPTRLPIESSDLANEYLAEFVNLHGAVESRITVELVGVEPLNPIRGKIVYKGIEYFATESSVVWTSASKRIAVAGIRWDYDEAYRKNVLGYDK